MYPIVKGIDKSGISTVVSLLFEDVHLVPSKHFAMTTYTILKTGRKKIFWYLVSLLIGFLSISINACNTNSESRASDKETTKQEQTVKKPFAIPDTSVLTVAAMRPSADGKTIEIIFNEKEQILVLSKKDTSYNKFSGMLEESLKSNSPFTIISDAASASIKSITKSSEKELELYRYLNKAILKSEKPVPVDLNNIDTSIFNRVDKEHLIWPPFKLCTNIVPDYATAQAIFDYCAQQSCNLPGPYAVNPCIPFQYVIDGCYARAHKMRSIIERHFRYCSEKVFSFANQGNDQLAVRATKWGGCCVTWWYHVAPVIRVKVRFGKISFVLAYVIDPSMFNRPVLLSAWLQAQAITSCSPNAKVSTYTIQPSTAYQPANYAGTLFTTDPSYTATDATLIAYRNLVTCH